MRIAWSSNTRCAALLLLARAAVAQPAPEVPRVDFRAERLVLDPSLARLELEGGVDVRVDRVHLWSKRLTLWTDRQTVRVEGPAELALCPCEAPPVTFRFSSARVEQGDVFVTEPTVRAFGVPVFWLPALWLRSPSRWGLAPLTLAYRGRDGALVGTGVHAPIGGGLDVTAAAYVKGGADVGARLATERTESLVRWDYLGDSALRVDARGSVASNGAASTAWSIDALRGARALHGPWLLEEVALRQDRARGAATWSSGGTVAGVVVDAAAPRGGSLSTAGAVGPSAFVGFGAPLGPSATASADVGAGTWTLVDGAATTLLSVRGELRGRLRAGPFAVDGEARTRGVATIDEAREGYAAAGALGVEVSAPFVKRFGLPHAPMEHWITPFATGTAGGVEARSPTIVLPPASNGSFVLAAGGVRTTLGELAGDRSAASAAAQAGYAADGIERTPVTVWRASAGGPALGARAEGVTSWGARRGNVVLATARIGREDSLFLEGRAQGTTGRVPLLTRIVSGGVDAPWAPWLADDGWSVGGRLGIPWERFLSSNVAADYDIRNRTLLGIRGAVTYRHPCGCLAVTGWAGHRAGRDGADAFVTVGLTP